MPERVKRPAYQWYPGDFRRDTAVQACSFEARGLWREMLDLMHDGEPYGHLTAGGVPITADQLARLVGIPATKAKRWLAELESRKVFSRTDAGVIYSRRMVKDEHIRTVRANAGHLSQETQRAPVLLEQKPEQITEHPHQQNGTKAGSKDRPLSTATAVAVAGEQVALAARALAIRANQGLAEHPTAPQHIPRIIATNGTSHTAAESILAAGVPLEFAESVVYEVAKSHGADGEVRSLRYFATAVIRAWQREQESVAASGPDRPATRPAHPDDFGAGIAQWVKDEEAKERQHA